MKVPSLNVGTRIQLEGQMYVVDHSGPRGIALRAADPNSVRTLTVSEFNDAYEGKELQVLDLFAAEEAESAASVVPVPKGLSQYSDPARRAAALRKKYLLALCPTGRLRYPRDQVADALRKVHADLPQCDQDVAAPSASSFYEWRRRWINSSYSDVALAPRLDKRGRRPPPIPSALRVVLNRVTEEFFATSARPTVAETLRSAIGIVNKMNRAKAPGDHIPTPTLTQMRRVIESHDAYRLLARRYGKATADAKTRVYRMGPGAERPLERVEVDHTILDVVCVRKGSGDVYKRPWLTVLIDVATRMILGAWISYHQPNAATVLRVLKQVIRPKAEILGQYDLKGEWPAYGIPQLLIMDNGKEFHSKALEAAAEDLGISLEYCPSREPRFKGVIERFMRTISVGLIHMLPGTTFSNPADRDEYKPQEYAVLTIDELRSVVFKWIVEVYSKTFHRGVESAPLQRWKELALRHPPQMPANLGVLDVYLRPYERRSLGTRGIEINTLFYVSNELDDLRRRNGLAAKNRRLDIRADPDDLGTIRVLHPDTDEYFTARCTRPDYADGLSLEQHKFHKANAKAKYAQLDYESALLASKEEIRAIVNGVIDQDRRGAKPDDAAAKKPSVTAGKRSKVSRTSKVQVAHVEDLVTSEMERRGSSVQVSASADVEPQDDDRFTPFDEVEAFGALQPELI